MRRASLLLSVCLIAGCAEEPIPEEPAATFEEDAYAFCTAKDERWLTTLMQRVQDSLPPDFVPGTMSIEWLRPWKVDVSTRVSPDGRLVEDDRELTLRLEMDRAEIGKVQIPTYGRINPETCFVDQMETHVGYDRLDPATERFPVE